MTDASGFLVWDVVYRPFGEVNNISENPATNDMRFPGQWFQLQNGLAYNWHRHYDASLGRYVSSDPLGLSAMLSDGPNTYGYSRGNPAVGIDPLGLKIEYANHPVAGGYYHSKIKITPDDQAHYVNDPRFSNIDERGNHFATIGAGPSSYVFNKMLVYGANRARDVSLTCENAQVLSLPDRYNSENEAIEKLFELGDNYNRRKPPYTYIPTSGKFEFNSNSFISGIGNAAGFNMPSKTGAPTVGYSNPVPLVNFAPVPR